MNLEILIYDIVGDPWEGTTAKDVVKRLRDHAGASRIDVYVNSVGGDVFDGMAIYNALRRHSAPVSVYVDGSALSIASAIVQAGDDRRMGSGSTMMLHEPWTLAMGDEEELQKAAEMLSKCRANMVSVYAQATGRSRAEVEDWIKAETWFSAEEAVEAGLADVVDDGRLFNWDNRRLAAALHLPESVLPSEGEREGRTPMFALSEAPRIFAISSPERRRQVPTHEPNPDTIMDANEQTSKNLIKRIWNTVLGRDGEATDLDVLDETRQIKAAADRAAKAEERVTDLEKQNVELQAEIDELKKAAETATEEAADAQNEAFLETAVKNFKITRAQLDGENGFRARMEKDPESVRAFIESLPDNFVKPDGVKPPEKSVEGSHQITRAEARDAKKYRAAKRAAEEAGVEVEIID